MNILVFGLPLSHDILRGGHYLSKQLQKSKASVNWSALLHSKVRRLSLSIEYSERNSSK